MANRLSTRLIASIALVGECERDVLFLAAHAQQMAGREGARLSVEVADRTLSVETEAVPLSTIVDAISERTIHGAYSVWSCRAWASWVSQGGMTSPNVSQSFELSRTE